MKTLKECFYKNDKKLIASKRDHYFGYEFGE